MEAVERLWTADEFLALAEEPFRRELVDGKIVVNDPTFLHQAVVANIIVAVRRWIDEGSGGGRVAPGIGLRLDDRNVFTPDVVWYADPAIPVLRANAQLVPPDLAVEVRSPSTWARDTGLKRDRYERWGVGELWLVDTESSSVLVHRRNRADAPRLDIALEVSSGETLRSPLLPGLELPLAAIFDVA